MNRVLDLCGKLAWFGFGLGLVWVWFGFNSLWHYAIENTQTLAQTPADRQFSTPKALLNEKLPVINADRFQAEVRLNEKSGVLKTPTGLAPAAAFSFDTRNLENYPFVVVSSFYHNVAYGRSGVANVDVVFFDGTGKQIELPLEQFGDDPNCGMFRCLRKTFRASKLTPGIYSGVVYSKVRQMDVPVHVEEMSMMVYAAPGIFVPVQNSIPLYEDFFG